MQNSPDSSRLPAGNGDAANGAQTQEPGRVIDVQAEAAESEEDALREVSRLFERAPVPARKKRAGQLPPAPPQLPAECVGIGCLIRTRLEQLAERCGQDRECWLKAMEPGQ